MISLPKKITVIKRRLFIFTCMIAIYSNSFANVYVNGTNIFIDYWNTATVNYIGTNSGYEIFSISTSDVNFGMSVKNLTGSANFGNTSAITLYSTYTSTTYTTLNWANAGWGNASVNTKNTGGVTYYLIAKESPEGTLVYGSPNDLAPEITISTTSLIALSYCFSSGPSTQQSFTVIGANLTTNLTITPPAKYEISTSGGGGFSATDPIVLAPSSGSIASTIIYVRLKSGETVGDYNLQNIVLTSTGATTKNVACSGSVITTTAIFTQPTNSTTYCFGQTATALSIVANGGGLTYQWYSNTSAANSGGSIIAGETNSSYTPPTNVAGTKYYYCEVAGTCGTATSNFSTVITNTAVAVPGAISSSPACQNIGITYTKSTCAEGTCYWQTTATGTTTTNSNNTNTIAATTVYLRAYNSTTQCWSDAVSKSESYSTPATITTQPATTEDGDCIGTAHAALSITVTEDPAVSYQWYSNTTASNTGGSLIGGATTNSYTPPHTVAGTVYYYCAVTLTASGCIIPTNVSGAVITRALPIATAVTNKTALYSNSTLSLTGGPNAMATYAWSGINGFTSALQSPTITNPAAGSGTYNLVVTDTYGCVSASVSTATVTITAATVFYYDGVGDISAITSWGTNTAGTTGDPANFSNPGVTYNIIHNTTTTPTMIADWTVSGTGSKIVIGDGTNATNFTIPAAYSLSTTSPVVIDVKNNATLTVTNASSPSLGTLSTGSTVVYNGSAAQTIKTAYYYNLTLNNTRGGAAITLEAGTIAVSNVFTNSSLGTLNSDYTVTSTGNTFIFYGTGNQNIPPFTYYNLHTEMGGVKTLTGTVSVTNKLRIGNISTLDIGANKILNLTGSGSIVTLAGKFIGGTGTSVVNYTNAASSIVAPLNYNHLDITGGARVLQADSITNIAGTFTPGAGPFTTTNSTVRFNGGAAQSIPAFAFYSLTIANTSGGVATTGAVSVAGVFTLESGILTTTSTNTLTITNTAASAVSAGTTTTFVKGPLTRNLAANLSALFSEYTFPVGSGATYLPFKINTVTTAASAPSITVEAFAANCGGSASTGLSNISTAEYWSATYTGNLTSAKVTLTRQSTLSGLNAIGHSTTGASGAYVSIDGTLDGSYSVKNSDVTTFSHFVLGTRTTTPVTYTYDCSGDPATLTNWSRTAGTGDAIPASFAIDDATWIFNCDATISSNLSVTGSNSTVQINNGFELTIAENVDVTVTGTLAQQGDLTTEVGSNLTVYGAYLHTAVTDYPAPVYVDTVNNAGTITLYTNITIDDMTFNNLSTGALNIYNADFLMLQSNNNTSNPTTFNNSGVINTVNSNFTITASSQSVGIEPKFINATNASIIIDNTTSPNKTLTFSPQAQLKPNFIDLQNGSTIYVKGSDANITHANIDLYMSGNIIIEDGNLNIRNASGGGALNITFPSGGIYVYDTDNSGDGILNLNGGGGGYLMNVYGTLFATGMTATSGGGGSSVNAKDGGTIFIGDMGATLAGSVYVFAINVEGGGTLNYCGNISAVGDNVGTLSSGSNLNYAGNYYTSQNPVTQSDFSNGSGGATIVPLYDSMESCVAAFNSGVEAQADNAFGFLPIQLTMIHGTCVDGNITIAWQTASELQNDYFTLYRSFDGFSFEEIEQIQGVGNSNSIINYEAFDKNVRAGIVYYKLAQTDFDGKITYSKIITVNTCNTNAQFEFKHEAVEVIFDNPTILNHIVITTISGKILYSKTFKEVDKAEVVLPYSKGTYIISVITNTTITSQKFINN